MRISKPYYLFVPALIKESLEMYLVHNPPDFRYELIDFYFIINYVLQKQLFNKKDFKSEKEDESDFVSINLKYLKSVIIRNTGAYIKYLKNGEFIISDGSYIIGRKAYHYKVNPKYDLDLNTIPISHTCKLFKNINKNAKNKKAHYNRLDPHLKKMKDIFMNAKYDSDSALEFISQITDIKKKLAYFIQIESLKDKRLRYFKRNHTNKRLDTNLTNLKSELRKFLVGDFIQIDKKNSQPFFLNQLLEHITHLNTTDNNNSTLLCCNFLIFDLQKIFGIKAIKAILNIHQKSKKSNLVNLKEFPDAVNSGTLYEYISKIFNGKYNRSQIKEIMFKVLFSRNVIYKNYQQFIPYEKEKHIFALAFPFIAESIQILKAKKYKKLSIFLQKVESYIFIDCISKRLVEAGIIPLTIHDSVIVETKYAEKAKEIIQEVFKENFQVVPSLHINPL